MSIYTIPNMSNGIDNLLVDTVSAVPTFTYFLLFFVWFVIAVGGAVAQRRRVGTMDIPMWVTMGFLATVVISLPLSMISGLMDVTTAGILVGLTILSGIWLFMDRNRNEI